METRSEIESLREEIFREFEAQKKVEILETLEEAKEAWMEESEELKREEVNEAMAYLESEYTKRMEEFKHTELKEALEKARQQWTAEELSRREEIVKVKRKLSMFALYCYVPLALFLISFKVPTHPLNRQAIAFWYYATC